MFSSNGFVCRFCILAVVAVMVLAPRTSSVDAAIPSNDECENAIILQTSSTSTTVLTGSTLDASIDGLNICGENLVTSPGVWYLYQSSSTTVVHVSTCTNDTNFDTALTVYEGDCSSLKCVDGRNDDLECDNDQHSTVSWQAAAGQEYHVLVHGSEANFTGDFGLIVTESEPLSPTSSAVERLNYWYLLLKWWGCFALAVVLFDGFWVDRES